MQIAQLTAGYHRGANVLHGVSFQVERGEILAVLGRDGVGKTALLRAIFGVIHPVAGDVRLDGRRINTLPSFQVARLGVGHVPEGRRVIPGMSVLDNLLLGAYSVKRSKRIAARIERVLEYFPVSVTRLSDTAGTLSGGQQQMLAIAWALMSDPPTLLLDEPLTGLAPAIQADVITRIHATAGIVRCRTRAADAGRRHVYRWIVERSAVIRRRLAATLHYVVDQPTVCWYDKTMGTAETLDSYRFDLPHRVAAPLREQVVAAVREAIIDGTLKAGQRLTERSLQDALRASRTTVREALRQLEAEGHIRVIAGRGAEVAQLGMDDVREIYELRTALEPLAVALFVPNATPAEYDELAGANDDLNKAFDAGIITDILVQKDQWFGILYRGARNNLLHDWVNQLHARITRYRSLSMTRPGRIMSSQSEIAQIYDAIVRRDGAAAAEFCRIHIVNALQSVTESITKKNLSTT